MILQAYLLGNWFLHSAVPNFPIVFCLTAPIQWPRGPFSSSAIRFWSAWTHNFLRWISWSHLLPQDWPTILPILGSWPADFYPWYDLENSGRCCEIETVWLRTNPTSSKKQGFSNHLALWDRGLTPNQNESLKDSQTCRHPNIQTMIFPTKKATKKKDRNGEDPSRLNTGRFHCSSYSY